MAQDRRNDQRRPRNSRSGRVGGRHGFRERVGDGARSFDGDTPGRSAHGGGGRPDAGRRRGSRVEQGGRGRRSTDDSGKGRGQGRPPQRSRVPEPSVPADVQARSLEASARRELRALGRANAENVARHLIMVQRLLDTDPELAYRHARYAVSHAGRVAVVRESAGIAGYLAGHYTEALRDIRAARRLSGLNMHCAIEADCERGLGRYRQALKVAEEVDPDQLDDLEEAELAMVVSGVHHEMGHSDTGLVVIEKAILMFRGDRETRRRLHSVRADRLEELGRIDEAAAVRERIGEAPRNGSEDDADVVEVYDIEDDYEQEQAQTVTRERTPPEDASDDDVRELHGQGGVQNPRAQAPAPPNGGGEAGEDDRRSATFCERVEAEMAELLGENENEQDADDAIHDEET